VRFIIVHDAAGYGNAIVADVDLRTSDQFRNVLGALAAKRAGQSLWSKHVIASLLKWSQETMASCDAEPVNRTEDLTSVYYGTARIRKPGRSLSAVRCSDWLPTLL